VNEDENFVLVVQNPFRPQQVSHGSYAAHVGLWLRPLLGYFGEESFKSRGSDVDIEITTQPVVKALRFATPECLRNGSQALLPGLE
jgi:hypothetical protein